MKCHTIFQGSIVTKWWKYIDDLEILLSKTDGPISTKLGTKHPSVKRIHFFFQKRVQRRLWLSPLNQCCCIIIALRKCVSQGSNLAIGSLVKILRFYPKMKYSNTMYFQVKLVCQISLGDVFLYRGTNWSLFHMTPQKPRS